MPNRPRCTELNAAGDQCGNRAKAGATRCGAHSGKIGRPTKLTRELADSIADSIRDGAHYEAAALAAGVTRQGLHFWIQVGTRDRDQNRDTPAAYFMDAMTRAGAIAEVDAAQTLHAARKADPRLALDFLKARNPAVWRNNVRVEHDGSIAQPVELVVPSTEEARLTVARILEQAGALEE